jgi:hypothetical protein
MRDSSVTQATPSEEFRDKMAYRGEIVSALEQAKLDDRHDLNGNALYRLQFKATVFPGQVKDKYGVARLTVLPPVFERDGDVAKLYLDWLAYVTSQLNPALPAEIDPTSSQKKYPETQKITDRYRLFGPATGAYKIQKIPYTKEAAAEAAKAAAVQAGVKDEQKAAVVTVYGSFEGNFSDFVEKPQTNSDGTAPSPAAESLPQVADGAIYVALPPTVVGDTLVMFVDANRTDQFVKLLTRSAEYLQSFSDGGRRSYLRWAAGDSGRCERIVEAPSHGSGSPLDFIDLARASALSDTDKIKELASALDRTDLDTLFDDNVLEAQVRANPANEAKIRSDYAIARGAVTTVAVVVARNVHGLAPGYSLAIERTISQLAKVNQTKAIDKLQQFGAAISTISAPSERLLQTLQSALVKKIQSSIADDNSGQIDDIYTAIEKDPSKEQVQKFLDDMAKQNSSADESRKLMLRVESTVPCLSLDSVAGRIYVPETFFRAVSDRKEQHYASTPGRPFAGKTYAYSTAPAELAQRVSSVASATQALDLMASVSAIIPSAGVGAAGSGEVRQVTSGRVDAIESAPLIVGFSNSGAANKERGQFGAQDSEPSFGWVFGPKVIVDAEHSELDLSQVLVEQPVTADISVPGWWTRMRLRVETAWAANFEKGILAGAAYNGKSELTRQPEDHIADYVVEVPLQTNPATYEQLTEYIANTAWGLQYREPAILSVQPKSLPACKDVTLLVSGPDLWRGQKVYLDGVLATSTAIMPDMQGLAATFDLSKISAPKAGMVLTIWTQLGPVSTDEISVVADAACAQKADTVKKPQLSTVAPVIVPGQKTSFLVKDDAGFGDYKLVLRSARAGSDVTSTIPMAKIDHQEPKKFVIEWPDEATFRADFNGTPRDGDVFQAELRHADPDDVSVLASAGSLYYYGKTLQVLLQEKASYKTQGIAYTITIDLPKNLVSALGDSPTAMIGGFKDATGSRSATDVTTKIDADTLIVTGNASVNWSLETADTLKLTLKIGQVQIGEIPVKKAK